MTTLPPQRIANALTAVNQVLSTEGQTRQTRSSTFVLGGVNSESSVLSSQQAADWLSRLSGGTLSGTDAEKNLKQLEPLLGTDDYSHDGQWDAGELTNLYLLVDTDHDNTITETEVTEFLKKSAQPETMKAPITIHRVGIADSGEHLASVKQTGETAAGTFNKNIEINTFTEVRDADGTINIAAATDAIQTMTNEGADFKALNFSIGERVDYDYVNASAGNFTMPEEQPPSNNSRVLLKKSEYLTKCDDSERCITPDTIHKHRRDLTGYLNASSDIHPNRTAQFNQLQAFYDQTETPLYIAAGNDWAEPDWFFNVLSAVKGNNVHVVSLSDADGNPDPEFNQNGFVTDLVPKTKDVNTTSKASPWAMIQGLPD